MTPLLLGATVVSVIGLLAAAAFGRHYRPVGRAGAAGCVGLTALDTAMIITAMLAIPTLWPAIFDIAASAARLTYTTRTLRPILAGGHPHRSGAG